jgi:hypothetical protein
MWKIGIFGLAFLCLAAPALAQSRFVPTEAGVRFSEQISNGPAGNCGCFAMEGASGELTWTLHQFGSEHSRMFGGVADVNVENAGKVSNAPYGLTLTSFAVGPRFTAGSHKSTAVFAQSLFGFAHGSGSEFPQHNSLVTSATSFSLDLGAGVDYPIRDHLSLRIVQLDYVRTALPNNTSNWQNNLRIGAGINFLFRK